MSYQCVPPGSFHGGYLIPSTFILHIQAYANVIACYFFMKSNMTANRFLLN